MHHPTWSNAHVDIDWAIGYLMLVDANVAEEDTISGIEPQKANHTTTQL